MSLTQLTFELTGYYPSTYNFNGYSFHIMSDETKFNGIIIYETRNTVNNRIDVKTDVNYFIKAMYAGEFGLYLGDAHGFKFQIGHGAGGILGQGLVDFQGNLAAGGHFSAEQMLCNDLLRNRLTHCPSFLSSCEPWHLRYAVPSAFLPIGHRRRRWPDRWRNAPVLLFGCLVVILLCSCLFGCLLFGYLVVGNVI